MEFVFPTAFVAFMMGIGALIVAAISLVLPNQYTLLVSIVVSYFYFANYLVATFFYT